MFKLTFCNAAAVPRKLMKKFLFVPIGVQLKLTFQQWILRNMLMLKLVIFPVSTSNNRLEATFQFSVNEKSPDKRSV